MTLYIFDADGTLRRSTVPNQPCPHKHDEWELLPGVRAKLLTIDWSANGFALASNQAGIAKGYLDEQEARNLLVDLAVALGILGIEIPMARPSVLAAFIEKSVFVCPHPSPEPWTDPPLCECRKPGPGMLVAAMRAHGALPLDTIFVGDLPTDEEAARRAGCAFAWAWDFFGRARGEWIAMLEEKAGRDRRHRETRESDRRLVEEAADLVRDLLLAEPIAPLDLCRRFVDLRLRLERQQEAFSAEFGPTFANPTSRAWYLLLVLEEHATLLRSRDDSAG